MTRSLFAGQGDPSSLSLLLYIFLGISAELCLPTVANTADPAAVDRGNTEPGTGAPTDPVETLDSDKDVPEAEKNRREARKLYVIGLGQIDRREFNDALLTFEQALELDPANAAILRELAPLALQLGETEKGVEYCRRAIEQNPDNHRLLYLYANRQAESGHFVEAVEALHKAIAVDGVLESDSRAFVQIRTELVEHLRTLKREGEMIGPLEDLLRVGEDPDKYDLGEFSRRQLDRRKFLDYELLGRAYAKVGRYDDAVRILEKGRGLDARGKRLALTLAEVAFEHGDMDRATRELDAYVALGAQNRDALELLAKILEKQGKSDDLIGQLTRWMETDADNPTLREYLVEKLIDARQFDRAEEELGKLRGRSSQIALSARLYREMKQPEKLLDALMQAIIGREGGTDVLQQIEAAGQDADLAASLAEAARRIPADDPKYFASIVIIAEVARRAKRVDLAVEFLNKGVEERPTDLSLQMQLLDVLLRNERFDELLAAIERAEKDMPAERSKFLDVHAWALQGLGRSDEAIELLEAFLQDATIPEDIAMAKKELARLRVQREEFDQAVELCHSLLADYPDADFTPDIKYMLASALSLKGDTEEYEQVMAELLDDATLKESLSATVHNDLGYTWADQGKNLDRAEELIRKALEIAGRSETADASRREPAAYLDSLGWVLFKKGRLNDAVEQLERAIEREDGQDAVIYDHLADVYWKLERADDARKSWEKSLELLAKPKTKRERDQKEQIERKLRLLADSAPPNEP